MFSVLFEVQPRRDEWDVFFARANIRRAELDETPGFIGNAHYTSLMRDGWVLSLSDWRDEESILSWHERTRGDEGRDREIVPEHRLRVGEVTFDTGLAEDHGIAGRGKDSGADEGTYLTLIDAKQTLEWVSANNPQEIALYLGFDLNSYGDCISWDIFNSLSNPGEIVLVVEWRNAQPANDHAATQIVPDDARVRVLRVVRDNASPDLAETPSGEPAASRATIGA